MTLFWGYIYLGVDQETKRRSAKTFTISTESTSTTTLEELVKIVYSVVLIYSRLGHIERH